VQTRDCRIEAPCLSGDALGGSVSFSSIRWNGIRFGVTNRTSKRKSEGKHARVHIAASQVSQAAALQNR
jgi:hypothetical protein